MRRLSTLLLLLGLASLLSCGSSNPKPAEPEPVGDPKVESLRAFAKLYGYVRYFHPSDEASEVDWNKLAVYGAGKVVDATSAAELKKALEDLFLPIAPSLQLALAGESPTAIPAPAPGAKGLELVSWQHRGHGLSGGGNGVYLSKRRNRATEVFAQAQGFGATATSIVATPHRGKQVRLRAAVRAEVSGAGNTAGLWLRVDRENRQRGFFDNMGDRPITTSGWAIYEIRGPIADDAEQLVLGALLIGKGKVWLDSFTLDVSADGKEWTPVVMAQPGFETEDSPSKWTSTSPGYAVELDGTNPHAGARSLRLESAAGEMLAHDLFAAHAQIGEMVERELGMGVTCHLPLALHSQAGHTIPRGDSSRLVELLKEVSNAPEEREVQLAAVIVTWNVFRHFYPYFDVIETDWNAVLTTALERTLTGGDGAAFERNLKWMVAQLHDGHGNVFSAKMDKRAALPAAFGWVEGEIVVIRSLDDKLEPGDVIVTIDGSDAKELVVEMQSYTSGSPQWKRARVMDRFGQGTPDSSARLVVNRGGEKHDIELQRSLETAVDTYEREAIERFDDGVYYIDLDKAAIGEIKAKIDEIASAPGVIFDLRGYPNSNHAVISHLLDEPDTSTKWMAIPHIIYPDMERVVGWDEMGWQLPVAEPHIEGKVVFITGGGAISYAESFMGFIEHYRLAEIVGGATAGANGNVNSFEAPGGMRVTWTGMRVLKHDGSQHHTIGIQPSVPMEWTRAGVAAGRDELLERALELARRKD